MSFKTPCRFLAALSTLLVGYSPFGVAAPAPPQYRVTHTVTLGAPDHWDYVVFDPTSKRVFVAHGDEVTVVSGDKGDIVGHVQGLPGGTHGIAVVSALGRGYTDDGGAGEAASFDLTTLETTGRIKAADDADAVTFDPVSGHVFTINGDTGTITVIDPKENRAVTTINGGGKLEYAVPDGAGHLYVNGAGKKEVLSIDTHTNKVLAHWPVPTCTSPHGLALDSSSHRLFVSCLNSVMVVVNAESGAVVTQLPIGAGSDAVVFDPKKKLVFSSNGKEGNISVIREEDPNTFAALGSIKTAVSARTMGLDPETGRLYLAAATPDDSKPLQAGQRLKIVPGSLKLLFLDPET